jgi:hypothetical protein
MSERSQGSEHLVVISLPLFRIARVMLSGVVLENLRGAADVLVVAPFADAPGFREAFAAPQTRFLKWTHPHMSRWQRLWFAASELMRVNGFWDRFANRTTAYYARNQYRISSEAGADTSLGAPRAAAYWLFSRIGRTRAMWRMVDRLLGKRWCQFPALTEAAERYSSVTLIQSANWGLQDRALATLSRQYNWRTVLIPYTTDQLYVNGFLLNDFDVICAQGSFEYTCAREFHDMPASRIRCVGSLWLRHLEHINATLANEEAAPRNSLIYAGVSPQYYPRESEFAAVDALIEFTERERPDLRVVYRPVEFTEAGRAQIEARFLGRVELQWPTVSDLGLTEYTHVDHTAALANYVRGLTGCRVIVMSTNTTLCLDAAFLEDSGIVSARIDARDVLRDRRTDLLDRSWFPELRVATTIQEMLAHVRHLLANPDVAAQEARALVDLWHYRDADYGLLLQQAVFGREPAKAPLSC